MSLGGKATLGANVLIRINTPPKVTKLEFSIEAVHIMSVATLRRFSDIVALLIKLPKYWENSFG